MADKNWPELRGNGGCSICRALVLLLATLIGYGCWSGVVLAAEPQPVAASVEPEPAPARRPVLRIGAEDSWPPYVDGLGQGLSTDIVKAAFAAVGVEVTIEAKPYARVLRELEAGQLDAGYNVVPQTSTEPRFIFGEVPLLTATVSFYYVPNAVKPYQSVADIPTGTTIASIIDYEYGDQYEAHRSRFREYKVMRQSQIIRMLVGGRVEVAVLYDRVAAYTLNRMELPPDTLVRGALHQTSDVYVAFSRKNPRSKEYAALLDEGLRIIRKNGVYDQILNQS